MVGEQVGHVPSGRSSLGLPGPEDPSAGLFVAIQLRLDELGGVVSLRLRPLCDAANPVAIATTHVARALPFVVEGPVVAGADAEAIQIIGAVLNGSRKFSRNL